MGKSICTALDIGSSKISCAIFEAVSKNNDIRILGSSIKPSFGVKSGVIEDIKGAVSAISRAVHEAEKQASVSSKKAIVNISNKLINSRLLVTNSNLGGRQILPKDLKDISDRILHSANIASYKICHFSPITYDADTIENVQEPEYMFANNLKSYHSAVYVPSGGLAAANKALRSLHFNPNFVVSSYAVGLSLVSKSYDNFIAIDIGAGASDIAVFGETGALLFTCTIPFGGEAITKDIAECFSIPYAEAEKLKILYGNVVENKYENTTMVIGSINVATLNEIISARLEEIFEMIFTKIPKEYHMQSLFLSGGVAKTLGIPEFITNNFGKTVEIVSHSQFGSVLDDPALSTTSGLINYYLKASKPRSSFSVKKILSWMWENF